MAIVALTTIGLYGQEAQHPFTDEYVLTTWDTDAGSPFLAVTAMAQTPDGYMWLGSYDGLARFDGTRFVQKAEAVTSAKDAFVLGMVVDLTGSLWLGTSKGIWRREKMQWEQFLPESGLLNGLVYSISCDSQGEIVALVGNKVVRWNGRSFEEMPKLPVTARTLSQTICFFDRDDRLWISARRFLFYLENGQWHAVRNLEPRTTEQLLLGAGEAAKGGIWFAEDTLLKRFHRGRVVETKPRIEGHQFDEVALWEDDAGNLWEAGERNGLVIHTADGRHLTCTTDDGLSNNVIIALNHDNEGNVWLGSDGGGMARIRPRSLVAHADRHDLPQPVVNSILELSAGKFLVGTHGGGTLPFENGRFGEPLKIASTRNLNDQSWVQVFELDDDGGLWIGTFQNGLYYIKGDETKQWLKRDLGGNHVYALHRDVMGRLWIGCETGLFDFEPGQFTSNADPTINSGVVNMIESDHSNRVWAASRDGDLWRQAGDSFERVSSLAGHDVGRVRFLYRSEANELWITNDQNEIFREYRDAWVRYGQNSGLPSGEWKPIAADDEGYHWFGSDRGVMRITQESLDAVAWADSGELRCQILNHLDGMKSPRVRRDFPQIGMRSQDGKIWIATIKGVVELDPTAIRIPPQSPQIHIEQVRNGDTSLKRTIHPNDVIRIPAGAERINIRYAGTSVSYGKFLTYTYNLDGVDAGWISAGDELVARLTDLRPGSYLFRVRVLSLENRVEDEARVTLIVEPFWWQRWGVRFLGAMLLLVIISVGVTMTVRARYRRHSETLEQARELAEERLRTSEVEQEVEIATEANRAKSDFLATMSHEIRTPLNGVIGSMDLMLETSLDHEQREHMTTLNASAETLLAVLNDILDFSKIEAGKIVIEEIQFDLSLTLREVIGVVVPRALNKGIELALIIPPQLPLLVTGDSARLRQVLINLVGNAVKFTEKGWIIVKVVKVKTEDLDSSSNSVFRFCVKDTGVGIDPSRQASLFDQFTQADASTTRKYGGTGLGLAICKSLVELMGGKINVSSDPGKGAEFYFDLPMPAVALPTASPMGHSGRAVVMEDLSAPLEAEIAFLNRCGISAQGSPSSVEALLWLKKELDSDPKHHPWLFIDESYAEVLSDDQTHWIQDAVDQDKLRVILMSPRPSPRDTSSVLPVHASLRKPLLDPELLKEAMADQNEADESVHKNSTEHEATTFDFHVLLADDDPINRLVLGKLLKKLGCTLDLAENGIEAIELVQKNTYALIFMDCRMPVMDGYTATTEIRRLPISAPPIVAITANTTVEDRERCTEVGMVDFVSKPVRRTALVAVIKKWTTKTATRSST